MDLMEIGCEYGRWIELAQDRVQKLAFVLAALNLRVLLPESSLIRKKYLREICLSMGGGWNWLRIVSNGGLSYYRC
jgi:hypothetical protein